MVSRNFDVKSQIIVALLSLMVLREVNRAIALTKVDQQRIESSTQQVYQIPSTSKIRTSIPSSMETTTTARIESAVIEPKTEATDTFPDTRSEIPYEDIVPYFDHYQKFHPITLSSKLQNLFDTIQPWPILKSNPNSTLIPWVHIPKTAGSSFKEALNDFGRKYTSTEWPYRKCFFPNYKQSSSISPGCRSGKPSGLSHCRYSELKECIDGDFANLYPDYNTFYDQYFKHFPRPEKKPKEMREYFENEIMGSLAENDTYLPVSRKEIETVKYMSNIRNPVVRTLSEYFYKKPSGNHLNAPGWTKAMNVNAARKTINMTSGDPIYTPTLEKWVSVPENTAFKGRRVIISVFFIPSPLKIQDPSSAKITHQHSRDQIYHQRLQSSYLSFQLSSHSHSNAHDDSHQPTWSGNFHSN